MEPSEWLRSYGWIALFTIPALALAIQWGTRRARQAARSRPPAATPPIEVPCELRLYRRAQRGALRLAASLAAVAAAGALAFVVYRVQGGTALPKADWAFLVQVALFGVSGWASLHGLLRTRIRLDGHGLHYRSGMPGLLQAVNPDWSVALHEIESVGFDRSVVGSHPTAWRMLLHTAEGVRKIAAWGWVYERADGREVTVGAPPLWRSAKHTPSPDALPMVQYLRTCGIAVDTEPRLPEQRDLFRAPRAQLLLLAALLVVAYAAVEGVLGTETYAFPAAAGNALAGLGAAAALAAVVFLRRSGLGVGEIAAVSVVVGLAAAIAGYPGGLRLNAATDPGEPVLHRYLHAGDELLPITPGAPVLDFWFKGDYLAAFERSTEHTIAVRRGGLGFLQVRKTEMLRRLEACGGTCVGKTGASAATDENTPPREARHLP